MVVTAETVPGLLVDSIHFEEKRPNALSSGIIRGGKRPIK